MIVAVLRVQGRTLSVDLCLNWIPEDRLQRVWRVGEMRLGGRISEASGFTLHLSEGDDGRQVVEDSLAALQPIASRLAELVDGGATAEIDLGLMVQADAPLSVEISPSYLQVLERCKIGIRVSAYPSSD